VINMPTVVSAQEWQKERDELLSLEKEATRRLDAIAARRRRLPMVHFDNGFMLNLFFTDGGQVYRTYATTARGLDRVLFVSNVLDLAPYGRQEEWEDSPAGWPQHPTYG